MLLLPLLVPVLASRRSAPLAGQPEAVARVLQSKDLSAETVKSAVQMLQTHYTNLRSTEAFHSIFEDAQRTTMNDLVPAPALPPRRRAPRRYDDGDAPHQWENPEDYFRSQFCEVVDLLTYELTRRFNQPTLLLLMSMEQVLLTAVNTPRDSAASTSPKIWSTCTQVTKVATIADMLAAQGRDTQSLFSEVDKLLRLYLTVPMSNATAERSFSSLRRLKTFLRSTSPSAA
ncbi:hypothetical protein KUCAC02_026592 [Chaenocephalus aceratus]|nr:hypothetical protein KUCAC02_026592 [Chaenocephalus aceratus]